MGKNSMRLLLLLLSAVMILGCFAGCAGGDAGGDAAETGTEADTGAAETDGETATENEISLTKAELGKVDWGGKDFNILVYEGFTGEVEAVDGVVDADGGSSQVINDAVYTRNNLLETECNLKFNRIVKSDSSMSGAVSKESAAPTGEFYLIDDRLRGTADAALSGYLQDYVSMGVDLDKSWWDTGTAEFALKKKVYFMCGDVNFRDDDYTYVLIFNKTMREAYAGTVADPYQTVRDWEWTLDYFNGIIQGISAENGDGTWDENDTYGFVTTWEYGNTFFIGSDLRYIRNDRTMESPELALDTDMPKALSVLDTAKAIFNDNNATYMSQVGEELKGLACFQAGHAMFYSEVAAYLSTLNEHMDGDYGVLPVPKYDKAQQYYRTWTHERGSCLSVTSAVGDDIAEKIGKIVQYYAIFSSQEVKPAYYNVMLTSRNVRDADSGEMLDLIFRNRVFDMAFYFRDTFGFYELFKTDVYRNTNKFSSSYEAAKKRFDRQVEKMLKKVK